MRVHSFNGEIITTRNATDLDRNRIRFNWGYHDGANDYKTGWERADHADHNTILDTHYDTVYARGYVYGYQDARDGLYNADSGNAWERAIAIGHVVNGVTDFNVNQWKRLIKIA